MVNQQNNSKFEFYFKLILYLNWLRELALRNHLSMKSFLKDCLKSGEASLSGSKLYRKSVQLFFCSRNFVLMTLKPFEHLVLLFWTCANFHLKFVKQMLVVKLLKWAIVCLFCGIHFKQQSNLLPFLFVGMNMRESVTLSRNMDTSWRYILPMFWIYISL